MFNVQTLYLSINPYQVNPRFGFVFFELNNEHYASFVLLSTIGLATKWLRILSIPPNDKSRNHLVANVYCMICQRFRNRVSWESLKVYEFFHIFWKLLCTEERAVTQWGLISSW